jgi:hypothetical protein
MFVRALIAAFLCTPIAGVQVYSPPVLLERQPDPTDLKKFAAAIYCNANATEVASVRELEQDPDIIAGNQAGTSDAETPTVSGGCACGAIEDLASLFSTTKDNYVRYAEPRG